MSENPVAKNRIHRSSNIMANIEQEVRFSLICTLRTVKRLHKRHTLFVQFLAFFKFRIHGFIDKLDAHDKFRAILGRLDIMDLHVMDNSASGNAVNEFKAVMLQEFAIQAFQVDNAIKKRTIFEQHHAVHIQRHQLIVMRRLVKGVLHVARHILVNAIAFALTGHGINNEGATIRIRKGIDDVQVFAFQFATQATVGTVNRMDIDDKEEQYKEEGKE